MNRDGEILGRALAEWREQQLGSNRLASVQSLCEEIDGLTYSWNGYTKDCTLYRNGDPFLAISGNFLQDVSGREIKSLIKERLS